MAVRHYLQFKDFSREEYEYLFDRTRWIKDMFKRYVPYQPLRDRTLAMVFEKQSTRTRVSFEAGMHQLGGTVITLMTRDRCGAISRRNTSLPPPGLEWVATLRICFGYRACASAFSAKPMADPAMSRRQVTAVAPEVCRRMIGEVYFRRGSEEPPEGCRADSSVQQIRTQTPTVVERAPTAASL